MNVYFHLYNFVKETSYIDLTGTFPHKSSRGNQYLLLLYDFDSNVILVEPLKTRQAGEMTKAWTILQKNLIHSGHITKNYIVDNEYDTDLKQALSKHDLSYELTPTSIHRRNTKERAIRAFKNHFLVGIVT